MSEPMTPPGLAREAEPTTLVPPGPASSPYQLPVPDPAAVPTPVGGPPPFPAGAYAQPPGGSVSGVAIAALVCGIAGFVPLVGVAAIVLGIVALRQLRRRPQRGGGMAIAGIVLGSLSTLLWAGFVVLAVTFASDPSVMDASGQARSAGAVPPGQRVHIGDLAPGDCFDGMQPSDEGAIDYVTTMACSTPHDAQIVTIDDLPPQGWPGAQKASDLAGQQCADKVPDLVYDPARTDVDLYYLYPTTAVDWFLDRSATCILVGNSGPITGSVLTAG